MVIYRSARGRFLRGHTLRGRTRIPSRSISKQKKVVTPQQTPEQQKLIEEQQAAQQAENNKLITFIKSFKTYKGGSSGQSKEIVSKRPRQAMVSPAGAPSAIRVSYYPQGTVYSKIDPQSLMVTTYKVTSLRFGRIGQPIATTKVIGKKKLSIPNERVLQALRDTSENWTYKGSYSADVAKDQRQTIRARVAEENEEAAEEHEKEMAKIGVTTSKAHKQAIADQEARRTYNSGQPQRLKVTARDWEALQTLQNASNFLPIELMKKHNILPLKQYGRINKDTLKLLKGKGALNSWLKASKRYQAGFYSARQQRENVELFRKAIREGILSKQEKSKMTVEQAMAYLRGTSKVSSKFEQKADALRFQKTHILTPDELLQLALTKRTEDYVKLLKKHGAYVSYMKPNGKKAVIKTTVENSKTLFKRTKARGTIELSSKISLDRRNNLLIFKKGNTLEKYRLSSINSFYKDVKKFGFKKAVNNVVKNSNKISGEVSKEEFESIRNQPISYKYNQIKRVGLMAILGGVSGGLSVVRLFTPSGFRAAKQGIKLAFKSPKKVVTSMGKQFVIDPVGTITEFYVYNKSLGLVTSSIKKLPFARLIAEEVYLRTKVPTNLRPFVRAILKAERVQRGIKPFKTSSITNINFFDVKSLTKAEAIALKKTLQSTKVQSVVFGSKAGRILSKGRSKIPKDVDLATNNVGLFVREFIKNLPKNLRKNYKLQGEKLLRKSGGELFDIKPMGRLLPQKNIFTGKGKLPGTGLVKRLKIVAKYDKIVKFMKDIKKIKKDIINLQKKLKGQKTSKVKVGKKLVNGRTLLRTNAKKLVKLQKNLKKELKGIKIKDLTKLEQKVIDQAFTLSTDKIIKIEGIQFVSFSEQTTRKALGTLQALLEKNVRRAKDPQGFIQSIQIQLEGLKLSKPKTPFGKIVRASKIKSLNKAINLLTSKKFIKILQKELPGTKEFPILRKFNIPKLKNIKKLSTNKIKAIIKKTKVKIKDFKVKVRGKSRISTKKIKSKSHKSKSSKPKPSKSKPSKSRLPRSRLPRSRLPKSRLARSRLAKSRLAKSRLARSKLPKSKIPRSRIPKSKLARSKLPKSRLPKSKLPKSKLIKSKLARSRLPKSKLPISKLPKSRLPKSKLPKSRLPKSKLPKSKIPKPRIPKIPKIPILKGKIYKGSFNIYVKKRGRKSKYVRINSDAMNKVNAGKLGRFVVDNTPLASYIIMPSSSKPTQKFNRNTAMKKFRSRIGKSKLPKGTRVERRKYRIDTTGEKQGISSKGIRRLRSQKRIIAKLSPKLRHKRKKAILRARKHKVALKRRRRTKKKYIWE